jgi:PAS domain S-box-containing protein
MIDLRHLGAAPDDIEKDFDAAALVRTHSAGSDARFGLRAILPQARCPAVRPALGARSAMEVALSRKGAKSRTRGRKLQGTGAKVRIARARKTRANLEQELKVCRREIAHARERLAEATLQQTATSEMLRLISNSPIQSVLDAVAEHAARLCDANNAEIFRLEDNLLRLAASYGEIPVAIYAYQGVPVNRDTVTGRAACDRRTIHVHDLAAEESEYPVGSSNAKREGHRTTLATPLLREGTPVGIILVRRMEVRPFSDKQIALLETFADQAVIAIENARLYNDLQEREARIRRLVDSNIIGIFIGDSRGRIIEANDAFLEMLGYGHDDVISGRMRWTKLTPTEWAPADEDALAQLSETGTCRPYEKEYYRKDGSRVPVLVGGAFFERKTDEGVVFVIDMSDRKRAVEALRKSEAKFSDYAATASDWLWEIGPDYKFTLLTENAFDSHPAYQMGTACWDHALDLETEPEKWRLVRAALDSRKPFRDFVYCSLDGNGSPMYVKASGKPVFDANGEFRGYRGTGTDVTELMRAQEALRESERSSRSAIDGIAGLVAIMAPNAELETVNRQVLEYFGRSLEWLKNWGTNDAVHPEDLPRVLELFKIAMASGIPFNFELRLRRFDGEYRWFDNRGVPIRDDSGRIVRWYVLLTDIEDRTRALARLDQMQSDFAHMNRVSMMGELVASLSHEIKQPIATARNNARAALNFLDKQPPDLGEVKEALGCIVGDADRAGDIIDRIRDHIKKAPLRNDRFDLNVAINEVIELAKSAITENGVSVQTRLAERMKPVQGDRVQVQQVVLNLILNAIEAMGSVEARTRELLVSTEQSQTNDILVAVRDSGPGIGPESLDRVFEAFYTTKSGGMGMGLSICRSIIDAHGGRLWADANEPRGAVFQFALPGVEKEVHESSSGDPPDWRAA